MTRAPELVPFVPAVEWVGGAPDPSVMVVEGRCVVCVYESIDGAAVSDERLPGVNRATMVEPGITAGSILVIEFTECFAVQASSYGWEQQDLLPLASYGLRRLEPIRAVEVQGSPWEAGFRGIRGTAALRHVAFLFHDSTVEVLAAAWTVRRQRGTLSEVASRAASNLFGSVPPGPADD